MYCLPLQHLTIALELDHQQESTATTLLHVVELEPLPLLACLMMAPRVVVVGTRHPPNATQASHVWDNLALELLLQPLAVPLANSPVPLELDQTLVATTEERVVECIAHLLGAVLELSSVESTERATPSVLRPVVPTRSAAPPPPMESFATTLTINTALSTLMYVNTTFLITLQWT